MSPKNKGPIIAGASAASAVAFCFVIGLIIFLKPAPQLPPSPQPTPPSATTEVAVPDSPPIGNEEEELKNAEPVGIERPTGQSPPESSSGEKTVHVRGYYRKDGTYVKPHMRRAPRR